MQLFFLLLLATGAQNEQEVPKVCTKCQKVNEWNKNHPNPYTYYEDYLKHEGEVEKSPFLEDEISFEN